jgi:hypothetical protein
MQTRTILAIVAVIVIAAGLGLWWWQSTQPPPSPPLVSAPAPSTEEKKPAEDGEVPSTPEVQRAVLPPLDASDAYVREQVETLAPAMAQWLKQDDLVRRFAVVLESAREGDYPRRQLDVLPPMEKFPVLELRDHFILDPSGYRRFDGFVDIATGIEPERAAEILRTLSPLLEQALRELGTKNPDPVAAMRAGIDQVLATPDLEGDLELVQPKVYYQFADSRLEGLKPLQKQLLRMGPQNRQRIKSYLKQVRGFL